MELNQDNLGKKKVVRRNDLVVILKAEHTVSPTPDVPFHIEEQTLAHHPSPTIAIPKGVQSTQLLLPQHEIQRPGRTHEPRYSNVVSFMWDIYSSFDFTVFIYFPL